MNPFAGYGSIVTDDRLAGRADELFALADRLSQASGSVSVIGEPRVGKSSLVNAVADRVRLSCPRMPVAWLDVSTMPNSATLFSMMTVELLSECRRRGIAVPPELTEFREVPNTPSYEAYRNCRLSLLRLKRAGVQQLVVLDEFDAVRTFEDGSTTIQRLRDLIYRRFETGLVCVFISRRSLRNIEQQVADVSTLDNVCEQFCVKPLNQDGIHEMEARCAGWELSNPDRELLWWYSGGHPYLAEMILCHSFDHKSIGDGVKSATASIFEFYQHLQRLLQEDGLFDQLLQLVVGPRWSVKPGSLEVALRYGLIRAADEAQRRFSAWSGHFQFFLEKCAREAQTWELWRETECVLREFIEETCGLAYGEAWLEVIKSRHKTVSAALVNCEERMTQEQGKFGVAAVGRVLDYSYPMDLWCLISCEWDLFRESLKRDKKYWADRFSHLAKVRTPTAHNRETVIPEHEIVLAHAYCKEILSTLRADRTVPSTSADRGN